MEDTRVDTYVENHGQDLTASQKAEAIRIGKIAYKGNTTLKDAGDTGILAARGNDENNRSKGK